MRLTKLSVFRRTVFTPGSAPASKTLRAQIDRDELPGGVKCGGRYYVDLDEWSRATRMRSQLERGQRELESSPALKGLV